MSNYVSLGSATERGGSRPANRHAVFSASGRVDCVYQRLWFVQVLCFSLVNAMLMATLVAASYSGAGFPCFYGAVVDYDAGFNASVSGGVWKGFEDGGIAPTLFLEKRETVFFFYFSSLVLLTLVCYVMAGSFIISREIRNDPSCMGVAHAASMVASPSVLVMGTLTAWSAQAVVLLLSHKLIVLAGALYLLHFILLVLFFGRFCGRGLSGDVYADDVRLMRSANRAVYRLVGPGRTIATNMLAAMVGLSTGMVSLMLGAILANSFSMTLWEAVAATIAFFVVSATAYLLVTELLVAHYVHVLLCPQLGVLIACSMLGVSSYHYFRRFAYAADHQSPNLSVAVSVLLSLVAILSLIMLIVRIVRAYLYHRRNATRFYGRVENVNKKIRGYIKKRRDEVKSRLDGRRYNRTDGGRTPRLYRDDTRSSERLELTSRSDDENTIYDRTGQYDSDSEWDD